MPSKNAASRITTIAQVHDHFGEAARWVRRHRRLRGGALQEAAGDGFAHGTLQLRPSDDLADKAVPLGLLINELVTNSVKHAYPEDPVKSMFGERRGIDLHVKVSDRGIGLPKDFDIDQPRASLGFKVIKSLVAQLTDELK